MFRALAQGRAVASAAATAVAAASATAAPPAQAEALNVQGMYGGSPVINKPMKLQGVGAFTSSRSSQVTFDNEWDMVDGEDGDRFDFYALSKVPGKEEVEDAARELCLHLRSATVPRNDVDANRYGYQMDFEVAGENGETRTAEPNEFPLAGSVEELDATSKNPARSAAEISASLTIAANGKMEVNAAGFSTDGGSSFSQPMEGTGQITTPAEGMEESDPNSNVVGGHRGHELSTLSSRWIGATSQFPVAIRLGGGTAVAEAFELFRNDPEVQDTVLSLARDPAMWAAFRSNDKVQGLLRRQARRLTVEEPRVEEKKEESRPSPPMSAEQDNPFTAAFIHVKNVVSYVTDSFIDLFGGLLSSMEKAFYGDAASDGSNKGNTILDTTMRSCVVLAIIVLAVVVLRRPVAV